MPPQISHEYVRSVPSTPTVAMLSPVASKDAARTRPACPRRKSMRCRLARSHSPATLRPAVTTHRPFGLNAASLTAPEWPRRAYDPWPVAAFSPNGLWVGTGRDQTLAAGAERHRHYGLPLPVLEPLI